MRALFEPSLVNDEFGDPGLYLDFRDERRALLFDLGDVATLPPRRLMRLSQVFVTHPHMDHFAGFDQLLRVVLGRKTGIVLYGGPEFIDRVEHKLRAYAWNVVHRYEVEFVIEVREVGTDGRMRRARFSSRTGFERVAGDEAGLAGDVIHDELTFRVRGRLVDHGIPCLALAIEEKARVVVARDRLTALGVTPGAWLRALKHAVLSGAANDTPIPMRWRDRFGDHAVTRTVGELMHLILDVVPGRRIGYVTDLRYTAANLESLAGLLADVDLLFIESVFLDEDADHAARKNHLTARQAGDIARRVGARAVVPFHFSRRYEHRKEALPAEVLAAWRGAETPEAGAPPR